MKKFFKYIIITLVSIPVVLGLLIFSGIISFINWHEDENDKILRMNKFDRALWLDKNRDEDRSRPHHYSGCVRGEMYYDLVDNYLKKGMSKEEVFELLGKPAYGLKYPNDKKRQYCLEYELGGHCSITSGPTKIMLICLQKNRVTEIFTGNVNNNGETFKIE